MRLKEDFLGAVPRFVRAKSKFQQSTEVAYYLLTQSIEGKKQKDFKKDFVKG